MSILGSLVRKREPLVKYRTVDGGHPAPFPDMTDEQLYNYETTFNIPRKTFDRPPPSFGARKDPHTTQTRAKKTSDKTFAKTSEKAFDAPRYTTAARRTEPAPAPEADAPELDLTRPVRTVTTKQPVEILTTRARHPVYKVHGYIGDDDVVTVFTLDGRLSENGPHFLENVPYKQLLHLNIYRNRDPYAKEKYLVTQHASKEEADAGAQAERLACVAVRLDQ